MFLNMSSASRYPLGALNSGNLGGGLLVRTMTSSMLGGDITGVSSTLGVSIPFAFGPRCASKFKVPELLRLQNWLVFFLFIVSECLSGCGTVRRESSLASSGSWPLAIGLTTPLSDFSLSGVRFAVFFLQKLPPEVLPKLSPNVEATLGVLGREGSLWGVLGPGETWDERRKFNRFRSPLGRRGELEWGVLMGERGKDSPA